MAKNERLDAYLVAVGTATGRDKAKELILSGQVTVNGAVVTKPSRLLGDDDVVVCTAQAPRYVGRGGEKLEAALQAIVPLPPHTRAMDVGASTGGFTHCLLQHGVETVYAIDVGRGQLHTTLVQDPRVVNLENTDIRDRQALSCIAPQSIDLLTMDVSFVSVRTVLPYVFNYLRQDAVLFVLIKPQFEAGRANVGKNGVVNDRRVHVRVLREVCEAFADNGCTVSALSASPLLGGAGRSDGNIEYIATLCYRQDALQLPDLRQLVDDAFDTLK